MMPGPVKEYEFYIVALTRTGRLVDAYVKAKSSADAFDKMLASLHLEGTIVEYKFCIRRELVYKATEL